MILHTIVPMEAIFKEKIQAPHSGMVGGVTCDVAEDAAGGLYLSRIHSTDLRHYLDPMLSPGLSLRKGKNDAERMAP